MDLETLGERLKVLFEFGDGDIEFAEVPFQPGEKDIAAAVEVIIAVQDAAVVGNKKLGDIGDHAFTRERPGSAQQENGSIHFPADDTRSETRGALSGAGL
jgi:hypothetical protein